MKLSEAIRLGAMLGPQLSNLFLYKDKAGISSCALGAAILGNYSQIASGDWQEMSFSDVAPYISTLRLDYPWIERSVLCPACELLALSAEMAAFMGNIRLIHENYTFPVFARLLHLNDYHDWTREQIAQWVASIEPQEDTVEYVAEEMEAVTV